MLEIAIDQLVALLFVQEHGEVPRTIYLQDHGLVALGASPAQVEGITAVAVKAARILTGTSALGGPHPMEADAVARIHTRPDERHRQRVLARRWEPHVARPCSSSIPS